MLCGRYIFKCLIPVVLVFVCIPRSGWSQQSQSSKIFINSAIYGTMAGALVGFGSIAFADEPRDKLQRIFRGASLGLYVGILLGAYVVYAIPDEEDKLEQFTNPDEIPPEVRMPTIYPIITDRGIEGAAIDMTLLRF